MEIKHEPVFYLSFDLCRPAYKSRKHLVPEPKPYPCSQEDHRQFQYPVGEKGEQNKEQASLLGYQVSDYSYKISIEGDK